MPTTPENLQNVAPQQATPEVDVLEAIKTKRGEGKKPQMNAIEVITKAMQSQLPQGMTIDTFMRKLATLLKQPDHKLIQIGNTVFLVKMIDPTTAEFHTFSAEGDSNLLRNYLAGAKTLKQQGIKRAISFADNPEFVRMAEKSGLPVKIGQSTKVMGGVAKPVYTFELEL